MPQYLSHLTLKDAISRLGISSGQTSIADYLVFKRALRLTRLANPSADPALDTVVTGTQSESFFQAHLDVALCLLPTRIEEVTARSGLTESMRSLMNERKRQDAAKRYGGIAQPFFVPFGARRDPSLGYRIAKWPSNGPSDTVGRWQRRSGHPIVQVPNRSPAQYRVEPGSTAELESFFITQGAVDHFSGNKPRLLDTAVWWFRFHDLQARFGDEPSDAQLMEAFSEDVDLTADERSALFMHDLLGSTQMAVSEIGSSETKNATVTDQVADPEAYLPARPHAHESTPSGGAVENEPKDFSERVERLIAYIGARGFVYQPWQIAAFVTAVRTKPFVLLAGISGTGKTKLPKLVAQGTGATFHSVAVRPDWTDSSELLGFERLDGHFSPGPLLEYAARAQSEPDKQFFFLLDEMNIARVEYYLAEVLSHLEDRGPNQHVSDPLMPQAAHADNGQAWKDVGLPSNMCLVGSVNIDETTHGFSRKVLDRAFVIEFSDIDLAAIVDITSDPDPTPQGWDSADWRPSAFTLASSPQRDSPKVAEIIEALVQVNDVLKQGQLEFGYRVRDEIVLLCLAASLCADSFVHTSAGQVDPLDLAVAMKVLPRIQGERDALRNVLQQLLKWAAPDPKEPADASAPVAVGYPFCSQRLDLMLRRLHESGFTNFWL